MPISRVMNNPDGSTPVPPVGGGDVNGSLNAALYAHAGTGAIALDVPRHLKFTGSTSLGIPGATAPHVGEGMGQAIAIEEGGETMTGLEAPAPEPTEPGPAKETSGQPDKTSEPTPVARSTRRK